MMRRSTALLLAASGCFLFALPARAQTWNDARSRALVEQATQRRALQIADTALISYKAAAHGYLTFLAQVGEGFTEPPRIVKADELALEVYWHAPNYSKQLIAGRRDTLLLPTDINYHRDHLGIVQNNFPNIIRLGEGDEVRDVPHPLSADGLEQYDYAIRDSLEIRLGPRTLNVYEVRVRPKNDRQPRAIGAVYIDRESREVVRMTFSFTRASLIDKELEDVSVVLENGLIEGRFWLPRRQEIEIRRTSTWLDYPARGIIRGRWEICCYEVNQSVPLGLFRGPEIALAPPGTKLPFPFSGKVLDSLPSDVRALTDADVRQVQEEVRELVRQQALARTRSTALSARSVSDFVRVNRVEGIALGAGVTQRLGAGLALFARARYGLDDKKLKVRGGISFRRASGAAISLTGYDDYAEAGDVRETSLAVSSIASQEFGSDFTDLYGARGAALKLSSQPMAGWTASLEEALERERGLALNATPASGMYRPPIAASRLRELRSTIALDRATHLGPFGFETQLHFEGSLVRFQDSGADYRYLSRVAARGNFERPFGTLRLAARTLAGWISGGDPIPAQHLVYLGGPTSAPGYVFHQFPARSAVSQRVELQFPVPFASFSLGRYGRTPRTITLAPFMNASWIDRPEAARQSRNASEPAVAPRDGWHPSVGIGALTLFDLLRLDVARGLRDGRWTFSVDVSRSFWPVL